MLTQVVDFLFYQPMWYIFNAKYSQQTFDMYKWHFSKILLFYTKTRQAWWKKDLCIKHFHMMTQNLRLRSYVYLSLGILAAHLLSRC